MSKKHLKSHKTKKSPTIIIVLFGNMKTHLNTLARHVDFQKNITITRILKPHYVTLPKPDYSETFKTGRQWIRAEFSRDTFQVVMLLYFHQHSHYWREKARIKLKWGGTQ